MIIDPDFLDHWKTRLLVDSLDGDETAPVYIIRLWAHCQSRREWIFEDLPMNALRAICRYAGDALVLESALNESGFTVRENGALRVCSWEEYNASLIANWRNGKKGGRPKIKATEDPLITHGYPINNPSGTDKIGLDEIGLDKISSSSEREQSSSSKHGNRTVLAFPTTGKLKVWNLDQSKLDEYSEAFQGVDVLKECRRAKQWCIDNPQKRKTPRGMASFLSNWIGRAVNRGTAQFTSAVSAQKAVESPPDGWHGCLGKILMENEYPKLTLSAFHKGEKYADWASVDDDLKVQVTKQLSYTGNTQP